MSSFFFSNRFFKLPSSVLLKKNENENEKDAEIALIKHQTGLPPFGTIFLSIKLKETIKQENIF
jgi:hypothetical protein